MKCFLKYSTEIRFVLGILENSKVIASKLPWKCVTPLETPQAKIEDP